MSNKYTVQILVECEVEGLREDLERRVYLHRALMRGVTRIFSLLDGEPRRRSAVIRNEQGDAVGKVIVEI